MTSSGHLVVFVKAPRLGFVKTRIAQTLGPERALEIYKTLVNEVTGRLRGISSVELRFAPDDAEAEIVQWLRPGWRAAPQGEGDLGERLTRAFEQGLGAGHRKIAVIGSDCPFLTASDIEAAFSALETRDVVLGPARDGGYWLIGLRQAHPELFRGVAWSTSAVLGETQRIASDHKLSVGLLRTLGDIDTEEDWRGFSEKPAAGAE